MDNNTLRNALNNKLAYSSFKGISLLNDYEAWLVFEINGVAHELKFSLTGDAEMLELWLVERK